MMKTWRFLLPAVPLKLFLLIPAGAVACSASSPVVINEVYYDHPGSDRGFEFVELCCRGEMDVPLEGWSLVMIDGRTGAARELWSALPGRIIESGALILIGGDSCAVSPVDLISGSIENGPDAVALIRGAEQFDLVPIGGDGLSCPAGRSLSRRPDGFSAGEPGAAFVCSLPTPGRRNFYDRDLSLSFEGPLHAHCISGRADIPVLLVNAGLERFSGDVELTVSIIRQGTRSVAGSVRISPILDEGEGRHLELGCAWLPPGASTLEISLEAYGDGNPLNDIQTTSVSSSPGEIVITEIMYRPEAGGEWIEMFNRSAETVDLSGWSVTDRSGASGTIKDGVKVQQGCFVLIAQDPESFTAAYTGFTGTVSSLEDGWPRLNDGDGSGTADEIFIRSNDGTLMESVKYPSLIVDERGRSIERLSPELCSADRNGIWLRCGAGGGATPGERNYCDTGSIPATGIAVMPDPFCPGLDGAVRFTAPSVTGDIAYGARIFDLEGREIARLASGPVGAPAVSFCWDGRDSAGRTAGTGLYICVVEFTGSGGGVCRREKGTVTVWSGQ
jgi:hypothetical protein